MNGCETTRFKHYDFWLAIADERRAETYQPAGCFLKNNNSTGS